MNPWLRHYSKWTCLSTLILIYAGAMVKSTGSGLAVPDWPLSYGMLFPPMVGGVFYEHTHRMVAAAVGIFTLILTVWLWMDEPRRWVRFLGLFALGAVILQGFLGGITVLYFLPTPVSVFHGILAQIFFILTIVIAYSLSRERNNRLYVRSEIRSPFLRLILGWIMIIFVQLVLGAVMRHTESGLAIPDFPKMGGMWLPAFNERMLIAINSWRFEHNYDPVNMTQVIYHFLHRCMAFIVIVYLLLLNIFGFRYKKINGSVFNTVIWLDAFVLMQIMLGIATVLTEKHPIITSFHVVTGAAILGISTLLFLRVAPVTFHELKENF